MRESTIPTPEDAAENIEDFNGISIETLIAERDEALDDARRARAEFINYKRRTEENAAAEKQTTIYKALIPIISVLDNIDRARQTGPLESGFEAIAKQLEAAVSGQGLTKFGSVDEEFDVEQHNAIAHIGNPQNVEGKYVLEVTLAGYRFGEFVVRPADVVVHGN